MDIRVRPIPPGSHEVSVWIDGKYGHDDIDLTFNFRRVSDSICEVSKAVGVMPYEATVALGIKAMELGYEVLTFKALKGRKVTRFAQKVGEDRWFDYYEVDLTSEVAKDTAEEHKNGIRTQGSR